MQFARYLIFCKSGLRYQFPELSDLQDRRLLPALPRVLFCLKMHLRWLGIAYKQTVRCLAQAVLWVAPFFPPPPNCQLKLTIWGANSCPNSGRHSPKSPDNNTVSAVWGKGRTSGHNSIALKNAKYSNKLTAHCDPAVTQVPQTLRNYVPGSKDVSWIRR